MIERDQVLTILRSSYPEMRERFGIASVALFGSVARAEATEGSDVDVLVDFQEPPTFDVYMGLLEFLEERLHTQVDLVSTTGLRPRVRPYVEREMIRVA